MTINEIARLAGVSRGTVDRVLHKRGKVKPEIQARIEEIIRETSFSPNLAASALKRSENGIKLGFLLPSLQNEFYQEVKNGVCEAMEHYTHFGVSVSLVQLDELTPDSQIQEIESLLQEGIDGLILTAIDTPKMTDYINGLAQELAVVTYNTDFIQSKRLCFVGQEHLSAGKTAGNLLCNSLRRPGKIVPLISYQNILAHTQRVDGLASVVGDCPVEVTLSTALETAESNEKAYQLVRDLLSSDSDVSCIYVAGGGQVGASNALADSGKADTVLMICYDLLPETIQHLKTGVVNYTIGQQPFLQGYLPVGILYEYLVLDHHPEKEHYYTSIDVRLRGNADFDGISAVTGII